MSSSTPLSPLYFLSLALLLQIVVAPDPLKYFCNGTETYSPKGPFSNKLNRLLSTLNTSPLKFGFSSTSEKQSPNAPPVYGTVQCRGDVSEEGCRACVKNASNQILQSCPNNTEAVIYYDLCQLKYSKIDFFGKMDDSHWAGLYNPKIAKDPVSFANNVSSLLTMLEAEAYNITNLYAADKLEITGEDVKTIYGFVQCTRDVSSDVCRKCLDEAIGFVPRVFHGNEGGRILGGSCGLRFEVSPFIGSA